MAERSVQEYVDMLLEDSRLINRLEGVIYQDRKKKFLDQDAGRESSIMAIEARRKYLEHETGVDLSIFDESPTYNFKSV